MKIKAALLREYGKPLTIEKIEIDEPGPNEVRIKTIASGVCHSDLHVLNKAYPLSALHDGTPSDPPAVLGHEPSGIVEAVGSDIRSVKIGDHVVASAPYCGICPQCANGHLHLCSNPEPFRRPKGARPRLSQDGKPVLQYANLASFAEMMLLHESSVAKIDNDIPLDRAALMGCAIVTGTGAALNTAQVTPGSSVAVFGAGGIGISVIQGARIAGARQIIAIDLFDHKLETALKFGATHTINGRSGNVVKEIKKLSKGGVDFSFDAVGRKEIAEQCLYCLAPRGLATLVGAIIPPSQKLELTAGHFFVEKRIQGCIVGSMRFQRDAFRYAELYKQGRLNLDDMISQRIRLEDVNDAFRAMEAGEVTRSVVIFD